MKNVFLSLSILLALSACDSNKPDYVLNDTAFCSSIVNKEYGQTAICKDKNNKQINGHIIEYFPSGRIHRDFSVKDGLLDGISKSFYENGKQEMQINYKKGKRHGISKNFYENGTLRSERNYKDDKLDGLSKYYTEEGKLDYEKNYKDDKLDGISKEFDENGTLRYERNYKNGKLEGLSKYYTEEGKLDYEYNYKNGKIVKEKRYGKNGKSYIEYEDKKDANGDYLQTQYEYNEYGVLVSKRTVTNFKETSRENTDPELIKEQCAKYIDICMWDSFSEPKPGCKTEISQIKIVSKNALGIQLESMPNVVIKTNRDYKVGDIYVPSGYIEYIGPQTYRVLNSFNTRIDVYEFNETNIPVCK